MNAFKAFRIEQHEGKASGRFVQMTEAELDPGDVTIKVAYSSVNFKDALAATGAGKIIRRFPCVGGIDMAGTIIASQSSRFQVGEQVDAISFDIGVSHHGGYAEVARVPAAWVFKLPQGLTLKQAMALGTAGFTAGLAVYRMEHIGLNPAKGPVIVNGATGGVGSLAVAILARRGYEVTALTGKAAETDYLKALGASTVLLRQSLDLQKIKPLAAETWAGAVDNLGGDVLSWILSTMQRDGTVASIGLAASPQLNATVMPFILRSVSLLGIDSGYCEIPLRTEVWRRLAGEDKPDKLDSLTREILFDNLPDVFEDFLHSRIKGRVVVNIQG